VRILTIPKIFDLYLYKSFTFLFTARKNGYREKRPCGSKPTYPENKKRMFTDRKVKRQAASYQIANNIKV